MFGLFKKKVIEASSENSTELVFLVNHGSLRIDTKFVVAANQIGVVMAGDKICDIFMSGEHTLTVATLPKTALALHLAKRAQKTGQVIKDIDCDIYIINTTPKQLLGARTDRFLLKHNVLKWVKMQAVYDLFFKIENASLFLAALRQEVAVVGQGYAEHILQGWAGDLLARSLERADVSAELLVKNRQEATAQMQAVLQQKLKAFGIGVELLDITEVLLPKHVSDKVAKKQPDKTEKEAIKAPPPPTQPQERITLMQVGNLSGGDRKIEMTVVGSRKPQQVQTVLNVDSGISLGSENGEEKIITLKLKEGEEE